MIEWIKKSYVHLVEKGHFSDEKDNYKRYTYWSSKKMIVDVYFIFDNIFIRFCKKIYRQVVGISMGTNCAPLTADLFLYCLQIMAKLHKDPSKSDLIDKFNNTYWYLDGIFSVNNSDFYKYTIEIFFKGIDLE